MSKLLVKLLSKSRPFTLRVETTSMWPTLTVVDEWRAWAVPARSTGIPEFGRYTNVPLDDWVFDYAVIEAIITLRN